MDRDKKITLSLFLSWVVFGLFNLFGQPQAFVPPIIVDGVLVSGLAIYFLIPFRNNGFYFALINLALFMMVLTLAETNWISFHSILVYLPFICCASFTIIMLFTAGWSKSITSWERLAAISIALLLCASFLVAFLEISLPVEFIYSVYMILGILSFLALITSKNLTPASITIRRIFLVLLLNFLFDTGNYLALLALA